MLRARARHSHTNGTEKRQWYGAEKELQLKSLCVYETRDWVYMCVCYFVMYACTYMRENAHLRMEWMFATCNSHLNERGKAYIDRVITSLCNQGFAFWKHRTRLNKVFRWTEFRVTLWRKMTCKLRIEYGIENCIFSERLSILNLANRQSVTLENWGLHLKGAIWKI